jgi:hypothetical protein
VAKRNLASKTFTNKIVLGLSHHLQYVEPYKSRKRKWVQTKRGEEKGLSELKIDNTICSSCLIFRQYNNYQLLCILIGLVTLTFYFKVKLFIIWKEHMLSLDILLRVRRSSPPIKLTATIYWNIVEWRTWQMQFTQQTKQERIFTMLHKFIQ